jgi:hypothetical protein
LEEELTEIGDVQMFEEGKGKSDQSSHLSSCLNWVQGDVILMDRASTQVLGWDLWSLRGEVDT